MTTPAALKVTTETRVGLQVRGIDVDPDFVAERLDLKASAWHRKGDPAFSADPSEVRPDGWCYFTSRGEVPGGAPVEAHLAWMLAQLEPRADMLASWVGRGWKVQLEIVTLTSATNGGPTLEPNLLRRVGALGLVTLFRTVCAVGPGVVGASPPRAVAARSPG